METTVVPTTECGEDHIMLVHCDRVEPNGVYDYRLYKLDYCLILRNDLARSRIRYQLCSFFYWSLIFVNFVIVQYNISTKKCEKLLYKYRSTRPAYR